MIKKVTPILLAALVLALVPTTALLACTATCGGTTCTGTALCSCDETGAHCEDYTLTAQSLDAQAAYARRFDTPALNSVADAIERMADALDAGDQDAYFVSLLQRSAALKSLSARERWILNSWHGGDFKPAVPAQE